MAHFAEIDENNNVIRVVVTDNDDPNGDEGYQWLIDNLGGKWVKTSYNAYRGKKWDRQNNVLTDELGFRKNYAGVGYIYDEELDAFIQPKPENMDYLIFNEDSGVWDYPIPYPTDGKNYIWDEAELNWIENETLA